MAVSLPPDDDVDLESKEVKKFLDKGSPSSIKKEEDTPDVYGKGWKQIMVRIPVKMLEDIEKKVSKNIGMSRNAWILKKLQEILDYETE